MHFLINGLARSMAEKIRFDNGTDFVGVNLNVKKQHPSYKALTKNKWEFNPRSLHTWVWVWERPIRTVKNVMMILNKKQAVVYEKLETFVRLNLSLVTDHLCLFQMTQLTLNR